MPCREDLADPARLGGTLLSRGGRMNPDVWQIPWRGRDIVVKDFWPRRPLVRATVGRVVTAREARAWRALGDHPAVPRFHGVIDAWAFAVEYRPGQRLSSQRGVGAGFLDALEAALAEMHARGVVHLDLKHRDNVLQADADGAPVLIDFGSALAFRPGSLLARLVLPPLAWIDRLALRKWRRKLGAGG